MSRFLPQSKGHCTIASRTVAAISIDIENANRNLQYYGRLYKDGRVKEARDGLESSLKILSGIAARTLGAIRAEKVKEAKGTNLEKARRAVKKQLVPDSNARQF